MPFIIPGVLFALGLGGWLWVSRSKDDSAPQGYLPQPGYQTQPYPGQPGYQAPPAAAPPPVQGPPQAGSFQAGYNVATTLVEQGMPVVNEVVNAFAPAPAAPSGGSYGLPANWKSLSTDELAAMLGRAMDVRNAGREQLLRLELWKRDPSRFSLAIAR